jgi:hypothetical protein
MGLIAEKMNALGETSKEAARKAEQGDATLNAKNVYGGWAKDFIAMLATLVDGQDLQWSARGG